MDNTHHLKVIIILLVWIILSIWFLAFVLSQVDVENTNRVIKHELNVPARKPITITPGPELESKDFNFYPPKSDFVRSMPVEE